MLLLFIISQLAVVVISNSLHKYPYVFLLDVGNEEIENLHTEQIRLTIPGGPLAIKYPATGEGDTIGHIRVSGIDFGANLKASIVQGGPGYKYVVLLFSGNPSVSYDAVVTIETISNVDESLNMKPVSENQNLGDSNESAEDTDATASHGIQQKDVYSENSLITQSSSNVYKYTKNKQSYDNDDDNDTGDETHSNDEEENGDEDDENERSQSDNDKFQGSFVQNDHFENTASVAEERYGKYEAFKPLIIGGVRFYPQSAIYSQDGYSKPIYDQENHVNDENQSINDDANEINYKDSNNNLSPDYASPVEY